MRVCKLASLSYKDKLFPFNNALFSNHKSAFKCVTAQHGVCTASNERQRDNKKKLTHIPKLFYFCSLKIRTFERKCIS